MTDPLGQSQVLPYLIGLSKAGHNITLISFEKPDRFALARTLIEDLCTSNQIEWLPLSYTQRPPVLSTLWDMYRLRKRVIDLHRENSFDLIHCRSYLTSLIGQYMQVRFGTKWIFDMRGFWADERIDGAIWNLKNPIYRTIYRFFKKKENQYLATADHIISLTQRAKSIMETWEIPVQRSLPITVIPCCVDVEHFNPASIVDADKAALREKLGIEPTTTVLSYVGSVGTWYLLPEMMLFFNRWLYKFPDSIFLFITPDNPASILIEAEANGISADRIIIRSSSRTDMPLHISISDYSLFFIRPSFSKQASSPTKLGEILAMGIPVICNRGVGDVAESVEGHSVGWVLDTLQVEEYDRVIANVDQTAFDATHIRSAALAQFSLDEGVRQYAGVYQRLIPS